MASRARQLLLGTVGLLGVATLLVAVVPPLSFGYRSGEAHVALETAATLIAGLAAFLLYGRLRERRAREELALFAALWLLTLANLARGVAPSFDGSNDWVVWVPLSIHLAAAVSFALAALAPPRRLRRPAPAWQYALAMLGVAAAICSLALAVAPALASGLDPELSPADAHHPRVVGAAPLLIGQLLSMGLFAAAAVGFSNRAREWDDELLAWLAIAAGLAALSRLNYFLFPSVYSEWVFTGDLLRLGVYVAILVGALRQIQAYQRSARLSAVLEERQRISRDLHDGLAQDLAFISMQGNRLADRDEHAGNLARAAQSALLQSRAVIANLRLGDAPLGTAAVELSMALANRHQARLELDVDEMIDVRAEERDNLLRILGESITNAIRHGDASVIRVTLTRDDRAGLRLRVADDGHGFDSAQPASDGGVGLAGIRERVEKLGAELHLSSRPGQGTTVEVVLD